MPALAQVANAVGSQSTYLVHLQRFRDDSWGLSWNYDNSVSARRLLVSSVSPCSPADRAGSLKRGDELLSANGVVEHEDMLRELDEALEVKLLFQSAAEPPTALPVSRGIARAVASNATTSSTIRRQSHSEAPSIKARVKNTFLHFTDSPVTDSGEAEGASSNVTPRSDPLPISRLGEARHYRSPYMRGCLAGLHMPHALALEPSGSPGQASARSNSSTDGTTSVEQVSNGSNGIPSNPSTDWDFPSYHHSPLQQPVYNFQPMQLVQAVMCPAPGFGVALAGHPTNVDSTPLVLAPLRPLPDLGSSSSEDVGKNHTDRSAEVAGSGDGSRKMARSDPSDASEAARSEAGPLPQSMADLWEMDQWTKPDDPQSSMDESTTYCSTLSSQQKKARRGGKRVNRPCHVKAKQLRNGIISPEDAADRSGDDSRAFYPSLTKQEIEQANLNVKPPTFKDGTLTTAMMREKILALQTKAMSTTPSKVAAPCFPQNSKAAEQRQADLTPTEIATTVNQQLEQHKGTTMEATNLTTALEDVDGSGLVGKKALLKGLVRMPEFNGEWGTVTEYDEDSQRYKVSVPRASGLPLVAKLRRQNLFIPTTVALKFPEQEKVVPSVAQPWCTMSDSGASMTVAQGVEDSTPASYTVPTTFQMEATGNRQPREASKTTLRRSVLRRNARQRAKSAHQLHREPSCPVRPSRQTAGGSLEGAERRQPSCPARTDRDAVSFTQTTTPVPKATLKAAKETPTSSLATFRSNSDATRLWADQVSDTTSGSCTEAATTNNPHSMVVPSSQTDSRNEKPPATSGTGSPPPAISLSASSPPLALKSSPANSRNENLRKDSLPATIGTGSPPSAIIPAATSSPIGVNVSPAISPPAGVSSSPCASPPASVKGSPLAGSEGTSATTKALAGPLAVNKGSPSAVSDVTSTTRKTQRGRSRPPAAAPCFEEPHASPPVIEGSPPAVSEDTGATKQTLARAPCFEEPPAPLPKKKSRPARRAGSIDIRASSSKQIVDENVPAPSPSSMEALTSQDVCEVNLVAAGDSGAPKKWQRHRAAREVQAPPTTASGNGPLAADCPTSHTGTTVTSTPENDVGAASTSASTSQGGRAAIAVRDSGADATQWRPTLRLRR